MEKIKAIINVQLPTNYGVKVIRLGIIGYAYSVGGWDFVVHKDTIVSSDTVTTKSSWVVTEITTGCPIVLQTFATRASAIRAVVKALEKYGTQPEVIPRIIKYAAEYGAMPEHVGVLDTTKGAGTQISIVGDIGEDDKFN